MTRIKRGVQAMKRRHSVLKQAKGFRHGRSTKERLAREALLHAYTHSFNDRRKKKGVKRAEWNITVNASARQEGISYSKLIGGLKKKNITINRKMLAELGRDYPLVFKEVVAAVK